VVKIAGSAFVKTGITSLTARGFTTTGSLFTHFQRVVRCLEKPTSVVIPSTVREIGEKAFECVSSLVDLSFEEGVERIKSWAFALCPALKSVAFPVSLMVIDESAFDGCGLRQVTFAGDSKLQCIRKWAFRRCTLERVLLPANVTEIDPAAFSAEVWKILKFEGSPHVLVNEDFLCSPDSVTLLKCVSRNMQIEVPAHIEMLGKNAFHNCFLDTVIFASGSRLREIGEEAFFYSKLNAITVPSSVEILGDRCFEHCPHLAKVAFVEISNLKTIGQRAFAFSRIRSFTIPASTNEIDGSAFVGCPLEEIDIDPGNRTFIVSGNTLLTSDGTEIVRSFGLKREIIVGSEVGVLQKSCFELLECLTELSIENESILRKISRSALSGCDSLRSIVLPASVIEIEEFAFAECIGLESCSVHKDAMLVRIGQEAFTGCFSLKSFYVPKNIEGIGANCFSKCPSLSRLRFGSGGTLKSLVRDLTLDEALEHLGVTEIWGLFRIEVDDDVSDLSFPRWISATDESSHLTLVRGF
jgi:hypothetical protein